MNDQGINISEVLLGRTIIICLKQSLAVLLQIITFKNILLGKFMIKLNDIKFYNKKLNYQVIIISFDQAANNEVKILMHKLNESFN